ncbi:MAG: hypothetical protein G8D81_17150 [gamma proteobacterium symbiont of Clathrolucina costata]|uniref:Protein argonaute n=1 Tax=Candidatus Thiodiazotropha taylori TaxID=2792791 RepID=A0A9E4NPH1_9GAMM|nr:SIR2 family protein [Candidatus Thiodiazotropha taylori]MCW4239207.1 SIR2 family protein [Candidatus Thiodiazotropha endolucinida]
MAISNQENLQELTKIPSASLSLSLDAFIRSIEVKSNIPHALFIGAGASISSGIPSAQKCIWEWKRSIFLSNNPGLEEQFAELSLTSIQNRIQDWLDKQGTYPAQDSPEEYGFYIEQCYPVSSDRSAFFQEKVRNAHPHIGYRLICHLAQTDIIRSVWSTNFDSLAARAAGNYTISPFEVGIDSQNRMQTPNKGALLCVSMHGDYRYDELKNTPQELQAQEQALRKALIEETKNTPFIVCGYSGRDHSIMEMFKEAYSSEGTGTLYWCGFSDGEVPEHVAELLESARATGRQAFYVPTLGFDDLMVRLGLYCLNGQAREEAQQDISELAPNELLDRAAFQVPEYAQSTIIKSNAFEIECPSEAYEFDLKKWPLEKVWAWVRDTTEGKQIIAVPHRGKILALGLIDDIKETFGDNIKGNIERTPISPDELRYQDGAIVSLMRQALVQSMKESMNLESDGRSELWDTSSFRKERHDNVQYHAYDSVLISFRRIGNKQYAVLKPSIKVLDTAGQEVPYAVAGPIKLRILGYQHNKPFNQAVNKWRGLLLPKDRGGEFEYPVNCGSTFKFSLKRSPVFGQIGLPQGGRNIQIQDGMRHLIKHSGLELSEPSLVFSNKTGTSAAKSFHPIKGLVDNRPYDYPLTLKGLSPSLRIGIICPQAESRILQSYLHKAQQTHSPAKTEQDYLVIYPGFQSAYGLPIEIPEPKNAGWVTCPEPTHSDATKGSLELANQINHAVEALQSSYAPHVTIIFFPNRWNHLRGFRNENEKFDVHDFVKAFCVHRGVATQFLNQDTMSNASQCRVWWWLSLALYVKGMRTPWVLDSLDEETAFVGLGFSIDHKAEKGNHVVLGCSHIYSARGEGLQYRLSKVENPIIRQGNPFMSRDDARRLGETIRQLFYDARMKLPRRVVLHKRTPFLKNEREGLRDGLSGVECIDMLEIQVDDALRYVASMPTRDGGVDEDGYPVRRGTTMKLDNNTALLWVHGTTDAVKSGWKYYQGKRRIPAPLMLKRHAGQSELKDIAEEILGLSKMNWNNFDLYTKLPATLQSSNEIARIGSLLQRFGTESYDYRLFI